MSATSVLPCYPCQVDQHYTITFAMLEMNHDQYLHVLLCGFCRLWILILYGQHQSYLPKITLQIFLLTPDLGRKQNR